MSVTEQTTDEVPPLKGSPPDSRRRYLPILVSVVPTALVVALMILRLPRTLYTSDSTAQESIVRTWYDVGHVLTYVPRDTWALKVPLYLVLEKLPLAPTNRLLVAILLLSILTFLMLGRAIWKLAAGTTAGARWYEVAVPLIWLTTVGGDIGTKRMTPNYRNIELGLCFMMLALIAGYLGELATGRPPGPVATEPGSARFARFAVNRRTIGLGLVAAVLIGVLGFDDPYIALLVAGPMIIAALGWYRLRQRDPRLLHLAAVLTASFAVTSVIRMIAGLAGVRFDENVPSVAVSPADLSLHLSLLLPSTALSLGVDNWDRDLAHQIAQVLVVVVAAMLLVTSAVLARYGWRQRKFVITFIALHWPLVLAGFMVSWHTQDRSAGRYLILAVFDGVVATSILLPHLRRHHRRLATGVVGLLTVAAVVNVGTSVATAIDLHGQPYAPVVHQQAVVRAVEQAVDEHGALKGYAPFWSANITSYLVGRKTTGVELVCRDGRLGTGRWLTDTARLERPAQAVFLIWDPQILSPNGCTEANRDAQFGPPIATYPVDQPPVDGPGGGAVAVLVYSPDIASRLLP